MHLRPVSLFGTPGGVLVPMSAPLLPLRTVPTSPISLQPLLACCSYLIVLHRVDLDKLLPGLDA